MEYRANIYISEDTWRRFRMYCLRERTTASKEIVKMVTARLAEDEASPVAVKTPPRTKAGTREARG